MKCEFCGKREEARRANDPYEFSIFGPRIGTWYVRSKTDSRWNNNGRGYGLVSSGGPQAMTTWIEKCKKEFGEPPEDAVMGFEKD